MFRNIALLALAALPLAAAAQQPLGLEPLPPPPPAPPGVEADDTEAPIRISPGPNDRVEETVIDGRRVLRVTTPSGAVYFLRDDMGESPGGRRDSLDQGIRVPLWVIHEF